MSITLDIKPETEAVLSRQAAAQGLKIDTYAASLLEEVVAHLPAASIGQDAASEPMDMVELFASVRGLFADGELDFSRNTSTSRPVDLS